MFASQSIIEDEPFILVSMVIFLGVMNWEKEIRKRPNISWKVRWLCCTWTRLLSHSDLVVTMHLDSYLTCDSLGIERTCMEERKRAGRWLTKVNWTGLESMGVATHHLMIAFTASREPIDLEHTSVSVCVLLKILPSFTFFCYHAVEDHLCKLNCFGGLKPVLWIIKKPGLYHLCSLYHLSTPVLTNPRITVAKAAGY